ncbi:S9 family peptidase, partial [Pseudomonas sp. MWU13-2860]
MKIMGCALYLSLLATAAHAAAGETDPYLWLENIQGKQALSWVGEQNARTRAGLSGQADYPALRRDLLSIRGTHDRIPGIEKIGV